MNNKKRKDEKNEDIYFKNNNYCLGTPVFLVDNGSYVQENSLYLGQRLMLMGLFYKTVESYVVLYSSRTLAEKIKNKYSFD